MYYVGAESNFYFSPKNLKISIQGASPNLCRRKVVHPSLTSRSAEKLSLILNFPRRPVPHVQPQFLVESK